MACFGQPDSQPRRTCGWLEGDSWDSLLVAELGEILNSEARRGGWAFGDVAASSPIAFEAELLKREERPLLEVDVSENRPRFLGEYVGGPAYSASYFNP